jgi:hypothetical protein
MEPVSVLMKLILAGEVDRLIAEAEALQSQFDGKRAVLRLLESQLEPGSSERGRVSMALPAPSPAGQYYRRHLALGPWRAAQEAAARDAAEMSAPMDTYPASAQRLALTEFASALESRDECDDWQIKGSAGHICAVPEGFEIFVMAGFEPALEHQTVRSPSYEHNHHRHRHRTRA